MPSRPETPHAAPHRAPPLRALHRPSAPFRRAFRHVPRRPRRRFSRAGHGRAPQLSGTRWPHHLTILPSRTATVRTDASITCEIQLVRTVTAAGHITERPIRAVCRGHHGAALFGQRVDHSLTRILRPNEHVCRTPKQKNTARRTRPDGPPRGQETQRRPNRQQRRTEREMRRRDRREAKGTREGLEGRWREVRESRSCRGRTITDRHRQHRAPVASAAGALAKLSGILTNPWARSRSPPSTDPARRDPPGPGGTRGARRWRPMRSGEAFSPRDLVFP